MKKPMAPTQQVTFVYVSDILASHHFYCNILGFSMALDQGGCRIYMVTKTAFIGICSGKAPKDHSAVILTFVSDDLAAWKDWLVAKGVVVTKGPAFNEKYNITHLFCLDPDGYCVEIQQFHHPNWPSSSSS